MLAYHVSFLHAVVQTICHAGLANDQCGCDAYAMLRLSNYSVIRSVQGTCAGNPSYNCACV